MIYDLTTLARVREHEIRRGIQARQQLACPSGQDPRRHGRLVRLAVGRLGSALVSAGRRLELATMEGRPQHGS